MVQSEIQFSVDLGNDVASVKTLVVLLLWTSIRVNPRSTVWSWDE